ncbi:MAG TPA: ABC transporter permease [Opitutaceae bacterium]|nr:ABC transporter permease [Opitutaceae bacterium]
MSGFLQHVGLQLRLHARNRMALVYGHLFPLLFLGVFAVLYRHETTPLIGHLGEWLTISILGGACFGLPTALVSEREHGVWRRYRLAPVAPGRLIAGVVVARFLLILSAALLQLGLARILGMPWPAELPLLALAFAFAAFAFIGLGLVIAAVANTVPAVQALGQCLFLPMLVIGGVAVPLALLPEWAQHVSGFLPGRYAVAALQAAAKPGGDLDGFNLLALAATAAAGSVVGLRLFRWDPAGSGTARGRALLAVVVAAWALVGVAAMRQDRTRVGPRDSRAVELGERWRAIDVAAAPELNIPTSPDAGVVTPFAERGEEPDPALDRLLSGLKGRLRDWAPARAEDPVQRVRNVLSFAAQCDIAQLPVERHVPVFALEYLQDTMPEEDLEKVLVWVIRHPQDWGTPPDLTGLGLGKYWSDPQIVRVRGEQYAVKFLGRLTGRVPW